MWAYLDDFEDNAVIFVVGGSPQQSSHSISDVTAFADDTACVFLCHMQLNDDGSTGCPARDFNLSRIINEAFSNVTNQVFHNELALVRDA